eukprot:CAMPEP_0113300582 /NCGR_PEP_ID=MMETSP0010_2-20120614/2150_1 /TAXON_ID=216773 ORGANISM="Corethron hystrix, Strain 308" /NCGR_SAMPLE_ID=MMETSP0010_2 /ASSEMBLY_ACC=CAM_ASM_000155 /LENGTH=56 /DNA_ID=CAMNT_0000154027 /DNA_START=768 /DNA_END=934 /DNA_ORIENTATION=+ /assembly_acc=CAM_ASM_000155
MGGAAEVKGVEVWKLPSPPLPPIGFKSTDISEAEAATGGGEVVLFPARSSSTGGVV